MPGSLLALFSLLTGGSRKGGYAQDIFTLRSTFFQGRPPKSVNMYWRRFAMSSIPIHDAKAFEAWVMDRWKEKEKILEQYQQMGRFPADVLSQSGAEDGYIETEVKLKNWYEIGQIFVVLACVGLFACIVVKLLGLA